jgi:MMP 1-O-methyltransferase
VEARLRRLAERAKGFMPPSEGLALYAAALSLNGPATILEVGTYCGKSTLYLAAAACQTGGVVFTVDHHRGSEEHQAGEEYHDPDLVGDDSRFDSLPEFRSTIAEAGLEESVVAVVGRSELVARHWRTPVGMLFLDGGHSRAAAFADYEGWSPALTVGGLLAIHDVFPRPEDGGRPPYEVYRRALATGGYVEVVSEGSLRILRRTS